MLLFLTQTETSWLGHRQLAPRANYSYWNIEETHLLVPSLVLFFLVIYKIYRRQYPSTTFNLNQLDLFLSQRHQCILLLLSLSLSLSLSHSSFFDLQFICQLNLTMANCGHGFIGEGRARERELERRDPCKITCKVHSREISVRGAK